MANIKTETLDKYLVQVRRVAESREKDAERKILKLYKRLTNDLNGFLGNEYAKYAVDDKLTYGILQQKGEYARFLEEVTAKVDGIMPEVKETVSKLVNETYEKCYIGMIDGVQKCGTVSALNDEFKAIRAINASTVKAAVQNPIPKLRLTPTLERNRKQVISGIKREIAVGLSQGDRMSTMAARINKKVGTNYNQSMLIARTEAHRVRETGLNDAANEVDNILKETYSEYRKVKTWNTCEDASVRDTHKRMDGKTVLQDEKFILPSGVMAKCPGTSGMAAEDCNCRCFLTHDIVDDAEYYAMTGEHLPDLKAEKIKSLEDEAQTVKEEISNYNVKTYSNIWKDDVTTADWYNKQGSISAKKQYFSDKLAAETDPLMREKWVGLMDDLAEFNREGKAYYDLQTKLNNIQTEINGLKKSGSTNSVFSAEAYGKRKTDAWNKRFTDKVTADKYYRPNLDAEWNNLTEEEKFGVWQYTHNSHPINRPLSGYDKYWGRSNYKGDGKLSWSNENSNYDAIVHSSEFKKKFANAKNPVYADDIRDYKDVIGELTSGIEKTTLKDDVWLVRGSDSKGLAGLLESGNISYDDAIKYLNAGDIKSLENIIIGEKYSSNSFMSTGIADGTGFGGEVSYKIYAPKGTKAIYAEPQSYYGDTTSGEEIYKVGQAYSYVGDEAEVIIQRGTTYRITDIKKTWQGCEIEMEVVNQPDYFKTGREHTFDNGATVEK